MTAPVAPTLDGLDQPLPDIQLIRGKNYPVQQDPDTKKSDYLKILLTATETDVLARYKQGSFNILFANGRQHISWKNTRRQWEDLPEATETRVTMNYIMPILRSRTQRMVSSEINWRGLPEDNSMHARDRTKLGVNLIKSRWHGCKMEQKTRIAVTQAAMTGLCALKSFWNANIGPLTAAKLYFNEPMADPETGEPQGESESGEQPQMQQVEHFVDANGQPVQSEAEAFHFRPGDTDTALRTIFNLRVNPEATGWSEGDGLLWMIDTEIIPITVAKEKFIAIADKIRPMEGPESSLSYERMIRGATVGTTQSGFTTQPYTAPSAKQADPSQLTTIREYWEMRSPFFPKGRLIVVVGGAVAYDDVWPQGVFPYKAVFGEPAVMSAMGRAVVGDMISPQQVINDEWTAIKKQSASSGAGQWVAWAIPGVPDSIPKDDNAIMQIPMRSAMMNRSIGDVIRRMDPGQVSPDRWRLIEQAKAAIFDIGAYHEVSRGQIPPGLDSGVAIQYLLEQETAQLKDAVDSLKESLIGWGRDQIAIARWGYGGSEGRWIPVDRPDLGFMIETVKGIDLPDPETMGLDIEYFRPQSEAATRGEVKELMQMGVIDQRKAMEIMDLGGGFEEAFISQTRHYAKARKENLDFERGQFVVIPMGTDQNGQPVTSIAHVDPASGQPSYPFLLAEDDDHATHYDSHAEIGLDESQPWPLRQVVLAHMKEHRTSLQHAMMANAQMGTQPISESDQPPPSHQ